MTLDPRDTLAVTGSADPPAMIIIECSWCGLDLVLDSVNAASVDCPECRITIDIASDPEPIALAA